MLNKEIQLYKFVKDFNDGIKIDNEFFLEGNIDIDKLLFNANCRSYELNKKIHELKNKKEIVK